MLTNTTAKMTYTVVDGVTNYAIGFVYNWNPDSTPQIKVYKNKASNTPLEYGVNYTISDDGLNIVLVTGVEAGDRIDIIRNIPMVQLSNYTVGRIDPEQIESDADASVMRDQQLLGDIQFVGEVPVDHEGRIQECESDIDDLESLVPAQATDENQLADKEFVNSSIATSTATFRGTYSSLADLQAVTADDNDYGFVVSTDAAGNTVYSRYKYASGSWVFEYNLNNSSFTAEQWAAINSGITANQIENWQENYGPLSIGAEIIGSVTVTQNGDVSGINALSYLVFPGDLDFRNSNTFEINVSFTHSSSLGATIFATTASIDAWVGHSLRLDINDSKIRFYVFNGSQNDYVRLVGQTTLDTNTKYYVRILYNGTDYIMSLSTDSVNYTVEATTTATYVPTNNHKYVYRFLPTNTVLHMGESYIKKNGIMIWRGIDCPGLHQCAPIGHEVIEFQAPTNANDYTWYRKYADGWVEQGGYTSSSGTWGIENIVFPVEMANIYYTLTITGDSSTNDYDSTESMVKRAGTRSCACNRSTTGFGCQSSTIVTWEVKGMYSQS